MKVISVENVSKKFILRTSRSRSLADGLDGLLARGGREDFWALKDLKFAVEQGEALGIIGHNGAGKSTMLKLLSRIMQPTRGRIRTRGRVSALIEIGAGFHPEMSGRENVYLNGSILGMSRREVDAKFDAIVSFAELEPFIDVPVKRYSSGMYARLGFSVAAHVDPEILLVDEVLSVGDERFQVKCQEHMSRMLRSGATVVFVSHNFRAVEALCGRCLVIRKGELIFEGAPAEAVKLIRRARYIGPEGAVDEGADLRPVNITGVRVLNRDGKEAEVIPTGGEMIIEIAGRAEKDLDGLNFGIEIYTSDGVMCCDVNSRMDDFLPPVKRGNFNTEFRIPECDLVDGSYYITVGLMDPLESIHYHAWARCAQFTVEDTKGYRGIARLGHAWEIRADGGS